MQTLSADEISKSYRGRRVVNGVSFHVEQGEVVGLLGPNGAGKTTSFYIVVGLIPTDTGRVVINDQEITDVPMYLRARNFGISYLPQEPSIFRKLTVEDNILAVLEAQPISWHERRERLERLIDQLGLGIIRKNRGYALSGGERRGVWPVVQPKETIGLSQEDLRIRGAFRKVQATVGNDVLVGRDAAEPSAGMARKGNYGHHHNYRGRKYYAP